MYRIFVCYRREDCPYAALLVHAKLAAQLGHQAVFIDTETIRPGDNWEARLETALAQCDVVVPIIGRNWCRSQPEMSSGKKDYVEWEIETALQNNKTIIPLLVDGAQSPAAEQLPPPIRALSGIQATDLPAKLFGRVMDGFLRDLEKYLPDIEPHCVEVPPGEFWMGSDEPTAPDDEKPRRRVAITRPFQIGKYPITQREYQRFMQHNPSGELGEDFVGEEFPVVNVSWNDAVEFCNRLSEETGVPPCYTPAGRDSAAVGRRHVNPRVGSASGYRLPTEAEWEYACRAGTNTRWFFGDDPGELPEYAVYQEEIGVEGENVQEQTDSGTKIERNGEDEHYLQEVGTRAPNSWGLYDLYGNVWEWCADLYRNDYYSRAHGKRISDPTGPRSGHGRRGIWERVQRGGSFKSKSETVRSANRFYGNEASSCEDVGFRIVRTCPTLQPTRREALRMVGVVSVREKT